MTRTHTLIAEVRSAKRRNRLRPSPAAAHDYETAQARLRLIANDASRSAAEQALARVELEACRRGA